MLDIFFMILAFSYGAWTASFIGCMAYRIPQKKPIGGRSECENCKKQISWLELFPVIGWLLVRGKCKNCKSPIPWIYPFVETSFGVLFLLNYLFFGMNIDWVIAGFVESIALYFCLVFLV